MSFFKKNNNGQFIGVEFSEYKGKQYINIREYYTNAEDEKKPTRKGVTFSADNLPMLVAAVNKLVSSGIPKSEPTKAKSEPTKAKSKPTKAK